MTIIDKRATRGDATFGEIKAGEIFIDKDNYICIKIDDGHTLFWANDGIWRKTTMGVLNKIKKVKATLTIEDM